MQIGLVGYGYWGKKMYRNLCSIFGTNSVYVCDVDSSIADNNLHTVNFTNIFSSNFLDKTDAVVVCTPVKTHFELAKKTLEAGKHVLLEKPATESLNQLLELKQIAENKNLILAFDHTFMYDSEMNIVQKTVAANLFGKLKEYISIRTIFGKFNRDVNVIWDLATHDFSILYLLKKELPHSIQVNTIIGKSQLEETAFILMKYKDGFTAHITCSWALPVKERKIFVNGENYQLEINENDIWLYENENEVNAEISNLLNERNTEPKPIDYIAEETLKTVISDFKESINFNKKPKSDIESAIFVLKILEACNMSVIKGGVNIYLD
jgi:predicted dehydrogenase